MGTVPTKSRARQALGVSWARNTPQPAWSSMWAFLLQNESVLWHADSIRMRDSSSFKSAARHRGERSEKPERAVRDKGVWRYRLGTPAGAMRNRGELFGFVCTFVHLFIHAFTWNLWSSHYGPRLCDRLIGILQAVNEKNLRCYRREA